MVLRVPSACSPPAQDKNMQDLSPELEELLREHDLDAVGARWSQVFDRSC